MESHALLETAVSWLGTGENEIDYWRNGVNMDVNYIFTTSQFYPMQFLLCKVRNNLTMVEKSHLQNRSLSLLKLIWKIGDELKMVRALCPLKRE